MELNKVFAAILLAGIIGLGAAFVAELIVAPDDLEATAIFVDVEAEPIEVAGDDAIPSVLPLLATADVGLGESLAAACVACHTFDQGGANGLGPNNWGVVGAAMGHIEGFNYSGAMQERHDAGDVWSYESLNHFLYRPRDYMPGTSMNYAGLRNVEDRAALIAWLRTLSDTPVPLPTEEEIAAVTGAGEEAEAEAAEDGESGAEDAAPADEGAAPAEATEPTEETAPAEEGTTAP